MNRESANRPIRSVLTLAMSVVGWLSFAGCAPQASSSPGLQRPPLEPRTGSIRPTPGHTPPPPLPPATTDPLRNKERETSTQRLAYPTGDERSSVILLEKRFPTQARLGQMYRYELKVTNLKEYPITDVTIKEAYPSSFSVLKDPNQPTAATTSAVSMQPTAVAAEAAGIPVPAQSRPSQREDLIAATPAPPPRDGSDFRYIEGVGYIRDIAGTWRGSGHRHERQGTIAQEFLIGTLAPKESKIIPVSGVSEELGKLDTRSTVTYTPVLAGGTDVINPILKLVKTAPRHADLCEPIEVRYEISNVGVGTETEVRIDETLPEGLTTHDGKPAVSILVGDLPQEQGKEFFIKLKAARTGEFISKASARGFGTRAQSEDIATAVHAPKLTASLTGPSSEYVGKSGAYELLVTNIGDAVARNTSVTVSGDSGAVVQTIADDPANTRSSTLNIGVIEPGASRKVRISGRPTVGGRMTVKAVTKADCADAVTAMAQTNVLTIAALAMEVTDRDDPVRVGEMTQYQIVVRNDGSGADRNVRVVASLPTQLSYVQSTGPTTGSVDGQQVTFQALPRLEPGQSVTWTVDVTATEAGDGRFHVELTSESLTDPVIQTQSTRLY